MSSEAPATDPAPAEGAPVEKTEKQLKREAEKKAKKEAEAAKKAAKLAARLVRGQPGGTITVGVVQHPPVELEPPSGTRVRATPFSTPPPRWSKGHGAPSGLPPTTRPPIMATRASPRVIFSLL